MLFSDLASSSSRSIGLDIGASHIKAVGLKSVRSSRPKLIGASLVPTPQGAISEGSLIDPNSLSRGILQACQAASINIKNQNVIIGLRGLSVLYKRIVMPAQDKESMADQILREAESQIDTDLNDWIIDYQIMTEKDDQGQVVVLLVAGRRPIIKDLQTLIVKLGGKPIIFDCDVFAISNIFELGYGIPKESTLFVDIGKESTKVLLADKSGIPAIVRSFSLGGAHLTDLIARELTLDEPRAEELKVSASRSGALFSEPGLAKAAKTHIDEIITELNQTIDFYASESSSDKISKISAVYLSGGAATTAGLAHAISQTLGARVEFLDPFRNIEIPSSSRVPDDSLPHVLATSVGLALRYMGDKQE